MRHFKTLLTVILLIYIGNVAFGSSFNITKPKIKSDSTSSDSVKYQLIINDPGYDTYLLLQQPMNYYSDDYYKSWNIQYVNEWNNRYMSGPNQQLYDNQIDYNPQTDYGIKLEYRLYYYFKYFEKKNDVRLLPGERG